MSLLRSALHRMARPLLLAILAGFLGHTILFSQQRSLHLSLYDCISLSRQSDDAVAMHLARLRAAHMQVRRAYSGVLPQLSLSGGWLYTPARISPINFDRWSPASLGLNSPLPASLQEFSDWVKTSLQRELSYRIDHVFYGMASLRQPLFAGGRIYQGIRLAEIGEQATEYQWQIEQRKREVEIAKTYWQAVRVSEQLKLLTTFDSLLSQTLSDVSAMQDRGIVSKREIIPLRVSRNSAQLQKARLQEALEALVILLKHQSRISEEYTITLSPDLARYQLSVSDPTPTQGVKRSCAAERVELQAASLTVEAEQRKEQMAIGAMLPEVGLTATLFSINPNPLDGMKREFGTNWMIGIGVKIPLTGIYQGALDRASSLATQQLRELELKDAERAIAMQRQQAELKMISAHSGYNESLTIRQDALECLELTTTGYKEGVVTLETLSMAQKNWLDAEMQHIDMLINLCTAQVDLNAATGQELYD